MSRPRPRVSDLTPDELEMLALEHVESVFIEGRAAYAVLRAEYHPVKLIKRHPLITAAVAAGGAFLLFQCLRKKPAGDTCGAQTPGAFDSLLSGLAGAAGNALPGLLASWMNPTQDRPE